MIAGPLRLFPGDFPLSALVGGFAEGYDSRSMARESKGTGPDGTGLKELDLLRELGAGSSGTVWEARLRGPCLGLPEGRLVAVKFLHQSLLSDPAAVERFRREAEIGLSMRHPNLVRIHGLLESRLLGLDLLALVMDLCRGATLAEILEVDGPLLEPLCRRVAGEAARGLAALHRRRIVHRDIKPANLHLGRDGTTRVMDFGFATRRRRASPRSSRGRARGALAYLAPECLRGDPAEAPADVYALGVTLFEIATGRHPFEEAATDGDAMIEAHLHRPPPRPSELRPQLGAFFDECCHIMLAKDPEKRPSAAEIAEIFAEGEAGPFWRERRRREPHRLAELRLRRARREGLLPFVGREAERARLDELLARAAGGGFVIASLVGPEGIGKRRLCEEWLDRVLREGRIGTLFVGEPTGRQHLRALSPIGSFLIQHYGGLETYAGEDLPEGRVEALRLRIAHRMRREARLSLRAAGTLSRTLCDPGAAGGPLPVRAAARALAAAGAPGAPLLLRIHRADECEDGVRRILAELRETPPPGGLFCLWTSHAPVPRELRIRGFHELRLSPLAPAEARRLVASAFERPEQAGAIAEGLCGEVPPLPGLLVEALRFAARSGQIEGEPGSFAPPSRVPDLPIFRDLAACYEAFFADLPPEGRAILESAAILGWRFRAADLADLRGEPVALLLRKMQGLLEDWILDSGESLRFRHRSQRRWILEHMDRGARIEGHRRAARRLKARGADDLHVAMQWSQAGDHEEALPLLLRAAETLADLRRHRSARRVLRRAFLHLDALPRIPLHLRRRAAGLALGVRLDLADERPARAQAGLDRIRPLLRALGLEEDSALLLLRAATALALDRDEEARRCLDLCLRKAESSGDDLRAAAALRLSSLCAERSGRQREALRLAAAALTRTETGGRRRPEAQAEALANLAAREAVALHVERAERHFAQAARLFDLLGRRDGLQDLELDRAELAIETGEGGAFRKILERRTEDLPPRGAGARARLLLAALELQEDRPGAAEDLLRTPFREAGPRLHLQREALRLRALLARDRLPPDPVLPDPGAASPWPELRIRIHALRAAFLRRAEGPEHALRELAACRPRPAALEGRARLALPLLLLTRARAARDLGREAEARRDLRLARRDLESLADRLPPARRRRFLQAFPERRALYNEA